MITNIDKLLSRSSHVAQIVLVVLALFGYFYTVVPIYQKEILTEEIAEKEIKLDSLEEDLKIALANEKEIKSKSKKLKSELVLIKEKSDNLYKMVYVESSLFSIFQRYKERHKIISIYDLIENQDDELVGSFFYLPYNAIFEEIKSNNIPFLGSAKVIPRRVADSHKFLIEKKLEEEKGLLLSYGEDIGSILSMYNKEVRSIIPYQESVDKYSAEYFELENVKDKYFEILLSAYMKDFDRVVSFYYEL